jgi:hypothetical protein
MFRINNSTTIRVKLGGAGATDFTVPAAMNSTLPYIFTLTRDVNGTLRCYINGGSANYDNLELAGSGVDADEFEITNIMGAPAYNMEGHMYDFIVWKSQISQSLLKGIYRIVNNIIA